MKSTNSENHTSQGHYQTSENEEESIDISELIGTIIEGKLVILAITVLFLIVGVTKVFLDTPIYKSDAMLQIEDTSNSIEALDSVASLLERKAPASTEIEIIRSRKILGKVVKNLNLDIVAKPYYFPVIGEAIARRFQNQNISGQVSAPFLNEGQYAWGGEIIKVDSFELPESWIGKPFIIVTGDQGHFKLLQNNQPIVDGEVGKPIIAKIGADNDTVTLFVSWLKARPGTQFVVMRQSLNNTINELNSSFVVIEKSKGTGILSFTLESSNPLLAAKIVNEIANSYVQQNVEQKSKEAQSTLEFLDKQLPIIKDQLEASTTALNDFRMNKGSIDLDVETQQVLTNVVEIKTQLTLLQQKRDELRWKFTESHPSVIAIDKQIARLQAQMSDNDKQIGSLPETQQIILRLSRDVKVSTELYTTLLNSAQTLKVAKAGTVGNVRIIDEALIPVQAIKPNKLLIEGVSLILGIISGLGFVFIRKALRRGIENPDQIEKQLHIPVYATIPHSNEQDKLSDKLEKLGKQKTVDPFILALVNNEDSAIESLRSLRTTLHFAFLEAKNNIIMISGPGPGVGKTFVSTNLAFVLAQAGKKILLIDGDLRKGYINKCLGVKRENGLSDLISSDIAVDHAIHHIESANFDFIATGAIPPNPSELLLHERFGQLLDTLSKQYDHIIIDSPPILAVTDACIIGQMASVTLMVIKAGQHPMRELEQSTKRLVQAGVHMKGFIFNDLQQSAFGYGYGYGYGYGKYVYQYSYQRPN